MNAKQAKAKWRHFEHATVPARVRLATPIARELVTGGIDKLRFDPGQDDDLTYRLEDLLGYDPCTCLPDDDKWHPNLAKVLLAFNGAFAIGVACGLLMRPEAFEKGGA